MVNVTVAQQQTGVAPNQGLSGSTIPSIVETSANPTIAPFMSTNNILGDGFGFVSPPSGDFFSFEGLPDFFDTNAAGNVDSIVENLFQGFIAPQYPYFT
jgi:hypothetical protein